MDCQATWSLTATPCGSAFVVDFAAPPAVPTSCFTCPAKQLQPDQRQGLARIIHTHSSSHSQACCSRRNS